MMEVTVEIPFKIVVWPLTSSRGLLHLLAISE
jgi:hypothetical protein